MLAERTTRRKARDERLLRQSEDALARVIDWLRDLDDMSVIDGRVFDNISEAIHGIEQARGG